MVRWKEAEAQWHHWVTKPMDPFLDFSSYKPYILSWKTGFFGDGGVGWSACFCWWMGAQSFSHVQLFATLWSVALQVPLFMEFSRQEYWSGLPFPTPGGLPNPGMEPGSLASPASAGGFFTTAHLLPKHLIDQDVHFTDFIFLNSFCRFSYSSKRAWKIHNQDNGPKNWTVTKCKGLMMIFFSSLPPSFHSSFFLFLPPSFPFFL